MYDYQIDKTGGNNTIIGVLVIPIQSQILKINSFHMANKTKTWYQKLKLITFGIWIPVIFAEETIYWYNIGVATCCSIMSIMNLKHVNIESMQKIKCSVH